MSAVACIVLKLVMSCIYDLDSFRLVFIHSLQKKVPIRFVSCGWRKEEAGGAGLMDEEKKVLVVNKVAAEEDNEVEAGPDWTGPARRGGIWRMWSKRRKKRRIRM